MALWIGGKLPWLWRAVDEHGATLDVLLQEHRDTDAAERFFHVTTRARRHCALSKPVECMSPRTRLAYSALGVVRRLELGAGLSFFTAHRVPWANTGRSGRGDRSEQPCGFSTGHRGEATEQSAVLCLDVCHHSIIALEPFRRRPHLLRLVIRGVIGPLDEPLGCEGIHHAAGGTLVYAEFVGETRDGERSQANQRVERVALGHAHSVRADTIPIAQHVEPDQRRDLAIERIRVRIKPIVRHLGCARRAILALHGNVASQAGPSRSGCCGFHTSIQDSVRGFNCILQPKVEHTILGSVALRNQK